MDMMWNLMDILFLGAGLYVIFAWYQMKTKGEIKEDLLLGKDVQLRKCKDLEGYKAYIGPKMLLFGIGTALYGGVGLINTYVLTLPNAVYLAVMAIFFVVLIWFAVCAKKGVKMFW